LTQAGVASTKAGEAAASATAAGSARIAAESARDQTLAAFDSFDDRYLGSKSSDPSLDNDGNALVSGALYFNTSAMESGGGMKVFDGTAWRAAYASLAGVLLAANNLSDLASASSARTNLGLGNVENKSAATILGELNNSRVVTALGFTPYNATNPSSFVSAAGARSALSFVAGSGAYNSTTGAITIPTNTTHLTNGAGYITSSALSPYLTSATAASTYQAALVSGTSIKTVNGQSVLGSGNIQIDGGVVSFNTRTGAVTLGSGDVTGALGFTPYNASNPSGYITSSGSIIGNAATATTLQTARTINGVSFNGSANITVADATKLPLAGGTMTGAISFAAAQTWPTFNQSTTGSAATLTTGRTIGMTGDVTWTSASFNGSANVTGSATLANSGVTAGTYTKMTVDAKGRVTAGATLLAADVPTLNQNTTGNAATATVLQTARLINGVSFNGSADITITDGTKLPLAGGTMTGGLTVGGDLLVSANSGNLRTIGLASGTNTTLVIQSGAAVGAGANIELTSGSNCYIDATITRMRSQNALTTFLDISASGTNVVTGALQEGGNQVLHAGNYTSYSPSLTGTGASGSWGISITGNAATATNGVVTTGSYSNPSWITSLAYSKLTGAPAAYGNTEVNAHLNTGSASAGEVLSWNGSDYDWVASGGSSGGVTTGKAIAMAIVFG
jgi:hypothetical protein